MVFGLNGFLHFLPLPPLEGESAVFMEGLAAGPYFFPMLKGIEIFVGVCLVMSRFVPLALALISPIVINIFLFHIFLAPEGIPIGAVVFGLYGFLMMQNRKSFTPLLRA